MAEKKFLVLYGWMIWGRHFQITSRIFRIRINLASTANTNFILLQIAVIQKCNLNKFDVHQINQHFESGRAKVEIWHLQTLVCHKISNCRYRSMTRIKNDVIELRLHIVQSIVCLDYNFKRQKKCQWIRGGPLQKSPYKTRALAF